MASKRVYLETTIPSYLTSRPSRDIIEAARQEITREWWEEHRQLFDLYVSQYVLDEAAGGDPDAARRRQRLLRGIPLLQTGEEVIELGEALLVKSAVPEKAAIDALHVAVATVHQMDVLLTWNCRHLANAERLGLIFRVIRDKGYEPPLICTPEELMGD
jgi:hypothetical protein